MVSREKQSCQDLNVNMFVESRKGVLKAVLSDLETAEMNSSEKLLLINARKTALTKDIKLDQINSKQRAVLEQLDYDEQVTLYENNTYKEINDYMSRDNDIKLHYLAIASAYLFKRDEINHASTKYKENIKLIKDLRRSLISDNLTEEQKREIRNRIEEIRKTGEGLEIIMTKGNQMLENIIYKCCPNEIERCYVQELYVPYYEKIQKVRTMF